MKRKLNSDIKTNKHLWLSIIKTKRSQYGYADGNQDLDLRHGQTCGEIKSVNEIPDISTSQH